MKTTTFGPAYDPEIDAERLSRQLDRIRTFMLGQARYVTLAEIEAATGDPEASISAQIRHLRKKRFGSYIVDKRRRDEKGGTWEYRLFPPGDPAAPARSKSSNGQIPVAKIRQMLEHAIMHRKNPEVVKVTLESALRLLDG